MANHLALVLYIHLHHTVNATVDAALHALAHPDTRAAHGDDIDGRLSPGDQRGQATTEYALVLLAAALVGLMVVAWATAGGGAQRISRLFNGVIDAVIDRV
jgi:hypothetical protein